MRVIAAARVQVHWDTQLAGMAAVEACGNPLPEATLASIRDTRLCLKGPLTTPVGGGYRSVNVALRQEFNLYANVRPAISFEGTDTAFKNVNLVTVRENTEGLYCGIEHFITEDGRKIAAESTAVVTRKGCERIIEYAFDYAIRTNRKKVTLVHKANILKCTSGLFLEIGKEIAPRYPEIEFNDLIVDACAMKLVMNPGAFDVIVTTNLFGDILSDLASGLIGGLGLTAGANIGATAAVFEAVHGSALDIAHLGIANPIATIMASVMMLEHLGETDAARNISRCVREVVREGVYVTPDLCLSCGVGTQTMVDELVRWVSV